MASKQTDATFAGVLLAAALAALGGAIYLAYVFPKKIAAWAESGRELSNVEALIVNLAVFCATFGFLVFPVLVFGAKSSPPES